MSTALFPAYDVRLDMQPGENIIEYIPSKDFVFYNPDTTAAGLVLVTDGTAPITTVEIMAYLRNLAPDKNKIAAAGF